VPAAPLKTGADFHLLKAMRHVALAVSGGSDSIGLLRLAAAWAQSQSNAPRISVLTVDHGLRHTSADEAGQVAAWAAALGLAHHTLVWSGPKPGTGIQSKARTARYDLMTGWCRANGAEALLTAHTLDDQAETVLMRLERTKSPASLSAIPAVGQWDGTVLLRPLLDVKRETLRDHLRQIGQGWIEDPSNRDPRFERVRVRQHLAELAPLGITTDRLSALSRAAAVTDGLLEKCSMQWLSLWLQEDDAGVCYAPLDVLEGLPQPLQQRILSRIIIHYGGGRMRPEAAELARLCHWLLDGNGPRCTLAGAVIGRRRTQFWVTREASRIDATPLVLHQGHEIIWDGRFAISGPEGAIVTPAGTSGAVLDHDVPVHARRAYPVISTVGAEPGAINLRFLRLQRP